MGGGAGIADHTAIEQMIRLNGESEGQDISSRAIPPSCWRWRKLRIIFLNMEAGVDKSHIGVLDGRNIFLLENK